MTRVVFDQSAKALLETALGTLGRATVQLEVPPGEPQWVDVWFEPTTPVSSARREHGLLGAMAQTPALFEPFHYPPGADELYACLRKQLALGHGRRALPALWIISGGRPDGALRGLAMRPRRGWPKGVYAMASYAWLPVAIVVTSELPERRDTLLVRLMGAGRTLLRAVREARSLPFDAWERRPAVAAIRVLRSRVETFDAPDQELAMEINETYEQWEARVTSHAREKAIAEGKAEGKAEGRLDVVLRLLARRFGPLSKSSEARVRRLGDAALDGVLERLLTAATLREALG